MNITYSKYVLARAIDANPFIVYWINNKTHFDNAVK